MISNQEQQDIQVGDIIEWQAHNRIVFGWVEENEEGKYILMESGKSFPLGDICRCPSAKLVRQ